MTTSAKNQIFRAGLVQMCSGRDVDKNVDDATDLIRQAAAQGAQYVQTPEVTTFMDLDRDALIRACQTQKHNTALKAFQNLADELKIWLHIGSMAILLEDAPNATNAEHLDVQLFANRSFLIAPDGRIAATYDKIHMFDVTLKNGETYEESKNYRPGDKAVVAKTPWGGLGMTICYDLRFPQLHRTLAKAGAKFITIPAAFTKTTGQAHWHTLVRARAIETQCFIFAATQGGRHENGRDTYGHALIVSPWGDIIAEGGSDPGIITADIDLKLIDEARSSIPSLSHDRLFDVTMIKAKNDTPEPCP